MNRRFCGKGTACRATLFAALVVAAGTSVASDPAPYSASLLHSAPEPFVVSYSRSMVWPDESAAIGRIPAQVGLTRAIRLASMSLLGETYAMPSRWRAVKIALHGMQARIAVIYPDIGEPYRSVFNMILDGIVDTLQSQVASFPVGREVNTEDMNRELRRQNVRVVIALGRHGLNIASTLDPDINVIAGGVIWAPHTAVQAAAVISLAPDPELLFRRLTTLKSSIRRIYVVYDPDQNEWLIELARVAAKTQRIELVVHKAQVLKTAVQRYHEILAQADPTRDALWLPQDSTTVDDAAVLPLVLQEAWKRSLVVFSSSLVHVPRGVLFSLYPNNTDLGRQLATVAMRYLQSDGSADGAVTALRNVNMAVNLRTASHLGIILSRQEQQAIELLFPRP